MSSEAQKGYLAGIIDGEGTISLIGNRGFTLRISNTNLELLEQIKKILIDFSIKTYIYKSRGNPLFKFWKIGYVLQTNKKEDIVKIIELIYPYIWGKKIQCELMRQVIFKEISFKEGKDKIKQLNKKRK